jgi:hypothetical protein
LTAEPLARCARLVGEAVTVIIKPITGLLKRLKALDHAELKGSRLTPALNACTCEASARAHSALLACPSADQRLICETITVIVEPITAHLKGFITRDNRRRILPAECASAHPHAPRAHPLRGARDRGCQPLVCGAITIVITPITAPSFGGGGVTAHVPTLTAPHALSAAPHSSREARLTAERLIGEAVAVIVEPITAHLKDLITREAREGGGLPAERTLTALGEPHTHATLRVSEGGAQLKTLVTCPIAIIIEPITALLNRLYRLLTA